MWSSYQSKIKPLHQIHIFYQIMKNTNRKHAIVAGISLLVMALAAGYAYGYVHTNLIVADDPAATLTTLQSAKALFGSEVIAWMVILITDLLVSWSLYRYFVETDARISLITCLIRAVYSVALAFAISHLMVAWQMLYSPEQSATAVMGMVSDFEKYWFLGLILFGVHLLGLGYLAVKSTSTPRWMGWLLYIAGIGYMGIHSARAVAPHAAEAIAMAEMILSAPMALAEMGLAVWLIWKGGRRKAPTTKVGSSSLLAS